MTRPHTIPIGGAEPIHVCGEGCWCNPLVSEDGVVIHHAKDMREIRERNGTERPEEKWVIVQERP